MDGLCELSTTNNTYMIEIYETWASQITEQELVVPRMSLFRKDKKRNGTEQPGTFDLAW